MTEVLTLDSLKDWQFSGTALAVIGDPIHHSLSPEMHNAALRHLSASRPDLASWRYFRFAIPADRLGEALPLFRAANFRGINLTIPHKVEVLRYLTTVDSSAATLGAVNTLVWQSGDCAGFNTDGFGIRNAVESDLSCQLKDADVLVLGAGGAARAVAAECMLGGCQSLTVYNRTDERLQDLRVQLAEVAAGYAGVLRFCPGSLAYDSLAHGLLVINVTALGLHEDDPAPCDVRLLPPGAKVYDSTYGCRNRLAAECAALGVAYSDGLSMLVWQGAKSFELWTGTFPDVTVMTEAARLALSARKEGAV